MWKAGAVSALESMDWIALIFLLMLQLEDVLVVGHQKNDSHIEEKKAKFY